MPRENSQECKAPEIDQKIDDFIRKNPKQFQYYNRLAKEHLARLAILKDIQELERSKRTRGVILRKLDSDPEKKKSVETLVRKLPEDVKRNALANIASRTFRRRARRSQPLRARIVPGVEEDHPERG